MRHAMMHALFELWVWLKKKIVLRHINSDGGRKRIITDYIIDYRLQITFPFQHSHILNPQPSTNEHFTIYNLLVSKTDLPYKPMSTTNFSIPTSIKWGKKTIELKLRPENGVKSLKAELTEQTGVPVERIKLMPKSKGKRH